MRRVLLRMSEAAEGELCLPEVLNAMRCVLRCIRDASEGGLCLAEVMCCVLLGMLKTVKGDLYSLEVLGVLDVLDVLDVLAVLEAMHRVLLCMPAVVEGELCLLEVMR